MQSTHSEQVERTETVPDVTIDTGPSVSVSGLNSLRASLEDVADSFDVTGYKCPKCGLVHKHDTTKHRLSDTFDVDESIATQMKYNSVCHCGVQEAARRGSEFGIDEDRAASIAQDAPIPEEATREMNEQFGAL